MKMIEKEAALASQEWSHWSKCWRIYLVVFGFATMLFLIVTDTAIFKITIISVMAGISAFLRELSSIYGRQMYSFIATLGVMVPIILLAPDVKDSGGVWVLLLSVSIVGTTIALLYGIIGRYINPNNRLQGTSALSRRP